jgi:hypothetical protein
MRDAVRSSFSFRPNAHFGPFPAAAARALIDAPDDPSHRSTTMSRGHGRVQLQVLEFLLRTQEAAGARGEQDVFVTISTIAGDGASRSRIESVRRAAKSLADEGLIVLSSDHSRRLTSAEQRLGAMNHSHGLLARLATPADQQARESVAHADSEMSA